MRALTFVAVIALSGCTYLNPANWHAYHMEIQQGNLITQDDVARLKLGMTRSQVRFVLGTPLIADSFHANRWDYKYQLFSNGQKVADKLLTVTFADDKLSKIDGDAMPAEVPTPSLNASAPAVALKP
ncbi:outer membrane protein assembly factor BamE [Paludibacterium sp. B53371]|uniref:outer membrane protein assembly factor BamE n=1 Tax=Paludibacterium sp. B53371 TaxID=2806263 RepID=UPI001C05ABF7|nr:outer membrane protein assembly factor BamE [Paludibacterium sp. B53371]